MERAPGRRRFLASVLGCASIGVAGRAGSTGSTAGEATGRTTPLAADPIPDAVGLETLATGMYVPLDVAFAPEADRRYVADKDGRIHVHGPDGLREEPFLDLRDAVELDLEMGLLGIALHPGFAENRRVFVRYSAPPRPGTPEEYHHTFVLAEFEASADGRRVDRDPERTILEIPEPQANHNSGSLAFGPDGHLYVGVGDGGNGGDLGPGHAEDWYDTTPGGNGQDVAENLLGSVLRIDVDSEPTRPARTGTDATGDRADGDSGYTVPEDNPLVGQVGLDEHFAWGFRNPWGMAFDEGDLYVADVGQSNYEEVNRVRKGGNYGWNVKEGTHCYGTDDCPDRTPPAVRGGESLRDPTVEYPHDYGDSESPPISGNSVIGGHVYRATAMPGLSGAYVFGDLDAEGRLFVATPPDGDGEPWPTRVVDVAGADGEKLRRVFAFGRDDAGAVYVLGSSVLGIHDESSGGLHRIVPAA